MPPKLRRKQRGGEAGGAPKLQSELKVAVRRANWLPWIFATKTTASGLLALLVGFTFDLDQPYWALLTVFIVSQPQSGLVLAKGFYRIIGTLIGAAVALLLVALVAQERILFLGALALWIGLCTFGSQYARNFAAYSFVLSGYTSAIIGIPGALDAGSAFFIAVARVTEISLGIIVTATISHVILPSSLAASLQQAVAAARVNLADYAIALFGTGNAALLRAQLLSRALDIEKLRASTIFADREVRDRSDTLRLLDVALISVVGAAQLLDRKLDEPGEPDGPTIAGVDKAIAEAIAAIKAWRVAAIDAAGLRRSLLRARAHLPPIQLLLLDQSVPDEEITRRDAVIAGLSEFFAVLAAYAEAYEVFVSAERGAPTRVGFTHSNDALGALWTGVRAAIAVFVVSAFWILADWPHGTTAVILSAVLTALLATMGHAVPLAVFATLFAGIAAIPAFVIVEMLLPLASGFPMFALIVAPMLFLCAFLIAHKKTRIVGTLFAMLFADVGLFQNRMAYDPVGLINTSIAVVLSAAVAGALFAIVAPETPVAARRRFVRVARRLLTRIAAPHRCIGPAEFDTAMIEALGQLQSHLRPDRPDDIVAFDGCVTLLGAGRELIRLREDLTSSYAAAAVAIDRDIAELAGHQQVPRLDSARCTVQEGVTRCLAELRTDVFGTKQAHAAAREIVVLASIRHERQRGGALSTRERHEGTQSDAA